MLLADVGDSVQRGFDEFATWVPRLLAFLVILVIGYFVAKLVARLVRSLLERVGFDRTLHSGSAGAWVSKITSRPSELLGTIAFWAIFVGAISIALDALGIQALQDFVGEVWAYVPNVIAALLILLVAGALAAGVATLVARTMGDTSTGRVVGTAAPILIMAIAGFMILDQLMIAEEIVTITYAALVGALALGMALAFGLGGREVASEMLRGAYEGSREQVKQDVRVGAERAKAEAQRRAEEQPAETDTVVAPYQEPAAETSKEPLLEDPTAQPRRTRRS
ncbi:MAG: mechanosensitive ion channel family protein [Gaiellaceae bacterium]